MRLVVALAALFAPAVASAAFDVYIQFDSQIVGESRADDYRDWAEVLDVGWSGFRLAEFDANGERSVSGGFPSEISVTQQVSQNGPQTFLAAMSGEPIESATLDFVRTSGATSFVFARLELEDVVVTSYKSSASDGDDFVGMTSTLHYGLLRYTTWTQELTGAQGPAVTTCFDAAPGAGPSC